MSGQNLPFWDEHTPTLLLETSSKTGKVENPYWTKEHGSSVGPAVGGLKAMPTTSRSTGRGERLHRG